MNSSLHDINGSHKDWDRPLQRLPLTIGLAFNVALALLWFFGHLLNHPVIVEDSKPIEAEFIELNEAKKSIALEPKVEKIVPLSSPISAAPSTPIQTPTPPSDIPVVSAPISAPIDKSPEPTKSPEPMPPAAITKSETPPTKNTPIKNTLLSGGHTGAQKLISPNPSIDEFCDKPFKYILSVRFHIGIDGIANLDIITPSPNLKLNRSILEQLKKWRFFPAMSEGKPIASDLDINFPLTCSVN